MEGGITAGTQFKFLKNLGDAMSGGQRSWSVTAKL